MPDAQVVPITKPLAQKVTPGIRCKAGWRHTNFTGHVYLQTINGVNYWVEVVRCDCLTWRTTKFLPNTGIKVGQRKYWRPHDADWPDDMTQEDCQRVVLESMLTEDASD